MKYYHAFYSNKQSKYIFESKKIRGNFYRSVKNGNNVLVTAVYSCEDYNDYKNIDLYFDDFIYVGVVDKWISVYK